MSRVQQPLTDVGLFYKQIEDFKERLSGVLDKLGRQKEIVEINKYYDKLLTVKKINPRKVIELVYQYGVTTYADQILTRDEQFLLGEVKTLTEDKKKLEGLDIEQRDLLFIGQIRVWDELHESVKANIWNYIQVVCLLAEKVTGGDLLKRRREELKQQGRLN